MKRRLLGPAGVLMLLVAVPIAVRGQIIENPAKPAAKDAGRVLSLREVWRITDDSDKFYFRSPYNLQVALDGSIFIADKDEFIKFSAEGRFIKNLYKKGQGPGEINDTFMFFIQGGDVLIQDLNSRRFWRAHFNGVFQEQIVLKNKNDSVLVGIVPEGFLFHKLVWPPRSEWTGKLMEILHVIDFVAKDGSEKRNVGTFKTKAFLAPHAAKNWEAMISALSPDGRLLFAFHGQEYLIEVVDIAKSTLIRGFTRTYPKVPYVEKSFEIDFRKRYGSPQIEYDADIKGLFPVGEFIWVKTSTDDKDKGQLIDVFDKDGRYMDSFFLGVGRSLMAVREDCLFCQEKNEDETIAIVKYQQ